jgi:hypothetical protein
MIGYDEKRQKKSWPKHDYASNGTHGHTASPSDLGWFITRVTPHRHARIYGGGLFISSSRKEKAILIYQIRERGMCFNRRFTLSQLGGAGRNELGWRFPHVFYVFLEQLMCFVRSVELLRKKEKGKVQKSHAWHSLVS